MCVICVVSVKCSFPLMHSLVFLFQIFPDTMESRFSHLRQRDASVSMLRVKLSRRRSQSQKENRDRAVNTRRQLDKLPELDVSSMDASIAMANMSTINEKTLNTAQSAKSNVSISLSSDLITCAGTNCNNPIFE